MKPVLFLLTLFFCSTIFSQETTVDPLQDWWRKDLETDSIPGIGLDRAYAELFEGKTWHPVVVAVLDTKMDIEHEELKDQIWTNEDEIQNNGLDDDNNGYVDDINGWNFLGNTKGGEVPYQLIEEIRVMREYEKLSTSTNGENPEDPAYKEYQKAKESLAKKRKRSTTNIFGMDSLLQVYVHYRDTLDLIFKGKEYTENQLDSLGKAVPDMAESLSWMSYMIARDIKESDFIKTKEYYQNALEYMYNPEMDDRINVEGGNPKVKDNSMPFQHATPVAALIVARRDNDKGLKGISDQIVLMPVVMVATGDEHDADVAKAIRYAVDNGADIINMSWGKYYSAQTELVRDAIQYAADHDVLLVTGAGNDSRNVDVELNYPTDFYQGKEQFDNFINAGGITHKLDSTLVTSFSNYGKEQVDLFAPAQKIYSANPDNEYSFALGTSFASPLTAGAAALLKGYYPELSAPEIKAILMESGDTIDMMVVRPDSEEGDPLVPFNSLSKTGKILNVYRALKLAEKQNDK